MNHPGPRSPVWAMPYHGGSLRLQVFASHRYCGVDWMIEPGSQSTMNPDIPSARKIAPPVNVACRHPLEFCTIPRPIHRSTSHGLTTKSAEARNGWGACEATVGSRLSRVSRAWFIFPRPLFLFLCWSWFPFSRERLRRVLRKKAAVILHLHTFTPADLDLHTFTSADLHLHTLIPADLDLHTFTSADLHLHTLIPADLDLHTFTPADLDLHTFTSADLHLHTFTPADLHLHTFTSADLHLHTLTSADLHLHTFTPADLDLHTFTPADLDLHTFTPVDLDLHTLTSADLHHHTLTSADLDLHTLTPADLDLRTLTPADLDLHILTPADLDLHTLTSADLHHHTLTPADLLSLFFYSLLRRGRCRRSATKRNPFARNARWTSKT